MVRPEATVPLLPVAAVRPVTSVPVLSAPIVAVSALAETSSPAADFLETFERYDVRHVL